MLRPLVWCVPVGQAEGLDWNGYMAEHPPSNSEPDPFHVRLEQLFELLFYALEQQQQKKKPAATAGSEGGKPGTPGGA